jgi:hypothetical protein
VAEIIYNTGDRVAAIGPTSNIATSSGDLGTIIEAHDGHAMIAWDEPKAKIGSDEYRLVSWAAFSEIKPYNPSWWSRAWSWLFD